jgi:hypothetical protein
VVSVRSIRSLEFTLNSDCPYLSPLIKILEQICDLFENTPDIEEYVYWNNELLNLEIDCFKMFIKDIKFNQKTKKGFEIEDILEHKYLNLKCYKTIENEYMDKPEVTKGKQPYPLIRKNYH